jgi:hypothetical protein
MTSFVSTVEGSCVGIQDSNIIRKDATATNKLDDCAICMETLNATKNFAKTNCGHSFCLSCLVQSLKSNNVCPLCRANIEEEKPAHRDALTLDTCVELIKDEIESFQYEDHLDSIMMFDNPRASVKNMLRIYSIGLSKSIIAHQMNEDDWESAEEEEDEEE